MARTMGQPGANRQGMKPGENAPRRPSAGHCVAVLHREPRKPGDETAVPDPRPLLSHFRLG